MLTETGRVVAVDADGLWVETIRKSTCGVCAAQKACGHGLINRMTDGKRSYIHVLPGDHATQECSVDDQVRICIPEEVILRGSFVAYLLPLICMLGGALLAVDILPGSGDGAAAIGAVAGLAVGFGGVRWHALSHRNDPGFQPVLLEVIQASPVESVRIV
jgi:sigma-E factor negative regulatory protein RseC